MNTSQSKYDSLEQLIFEENLRIQRLDFHKDLDLMIIVLNTKAVLKQKLSSYHKLKAATSEQLSKYQLIAGGIGVHWSELDEDLSLKGFLQDELRMIVSKNPIAA
jgi:uncharacterized protein YutD